MYDLYQTKNNQILIEIKNELNIFHVETQDYSENNILKHDFLSPVSTHDFLCLFCTAIHLRINTYINPDNFEIIRQKNITQALKSYFIVLPFHIPFITNTPIEKLRQNYILTILMFQKREDDLIELFETDVSVPFYKEGDVSNSEGDWICKSEDHPTEAIYERSTIKTIVLSRPILEAYKHVLSIQGFPNLELKDIENKLGPFIDTMKVYATNITDFGFTIFDGTIHVRTKFLTQSHLKYSVAGCFILTMIHEIGHVINRILKEDHNFYLLTEEMVLSTNGVVLKKNSSEENILEDDIISDFGEMVEKVLYADNLQRNSIGYHGGKFLLNRDNYKLSLKEFSQKLSEAINTKNPKGKKDSTSLKKRAEDEMELPKCSRIYY